MIWLLMLLCLVCGTALGIAIGWVTTSMRIWNLESKFRALALEIYEYAQFERSESIPTEWVQERLDSFVAQEFR